MKLSISSLVTWDARAEAAPAFRHSKSREPYRARVVDLDEDDAPTTLRARPTRAGHREVDARS